MRFNYTEIPNSQDPAKQILRPYLVVRLMHDDKHKDLVALIDSGADISLAHGDIARLLGLSDLGTGKPWQYRGSVNSQVGEARIHRLHLVIPRLSSLDLDIAFTDDVPPGTFLLGQRDFFESYQVRFDLSRRIFEILEVPRVGVVH